MSTEISREQIEGAKHTMVRRYTALSTNARHVLAELMSYDYVTRQTGLRKGEVWCSQQTIADNVGVTRRTVTTVMKEVVASPFVKSTRYFKGSDGGIRIAYVLDWNTIEEHTIRMIEDQKAQNLRRALRKKFTEPREKIAQEIIEEEIIEPQIVEPGKTFSVSQNSAPKERPNSSLRSGSEHPSDEGVEAEEEAWTGKSIRPVPSALATQQDKNRRARGWAV